MDLSRSPTMALPTLITGLLLLAAMPMFVKADGISTGVEQGQPANSLSLQANIQTVSLNSDSKVPAVEQYTASITIQKINDKLLLEARQAPLPQILQTITEKTGAKIHYSVLPEAPVTATCAGKTTQAIMDCLVAKQVGLVAHKAQKGKPAEFWLLGSSVGSCQAVTVTPKQSFVQVGAKPGNQENLANALDPQELTDSYLKQFKEAKTNEEKSAALIALAANGKIDDSRVRNAIQEAVQDKDSNIRAQGIATLNSLDKEAGKEALNNALHDENASVRMFVVDQIAGEGGSADKDVLQQALADPDASIRNYATAKLAEIQEREQRLKH